MRNRFPILTIVVTDPSVLLPGPAIRILVMNSPPTTVHPLVIALVIGPVSLEHTGFLRAVESGVRPYALPEFESELIAGP